MNWYHRLLIGVVIVGLMLGGSAGEAVGTDQAVIDDKKHSTVEESTESVALAGTGQGSGDDHSTGEDHNGGEDHENLGSVHLAIEVLQIAFGFIAVASVVLAGRVYGGEIGRALMISGVGVTLFAIQRLWHNFHELGFLGTPSVLGQQTLFILAAGALAAGYLSLYQTMRKRTA